MKKYCGNCGALLEEKAKFCGNCGAVVEPISEKEEQDAKAEPKKKRAGKKAAVAVAVIVIIALVAGVAVKVLPQIGGPERVLDKVITACENNDVEALVKLSPDAFSVYPEGTVDSLFDECMDYVVGSFADELGSGYELTYTIDDTYEFSNSMLERMMDDIWDFSYDGYYDYDYSDYTYYEYDLDDIEEGTVFCLTVTATSGAETVADYAEIALAKENGTWKLVGLE